MKNYIHTALMMLCIGVIAATSANAQNVLQLEPFTVNQKFLNDQIRADSTETGGIPQGRIYELLAGEIYLINRELFVQQNEQLHLRSSSETDRPIIYMFATGIGNNPQRPPGNLFRSRGGTIILEGLAVAGYYEVGDIGNTEFENLYTVQGNMLRTDAPGSTIIARRNIFSNINGQVLRTEANTHAIIFEDNILANLGALSTSNFGAGKGLDLRTAAVDSLVLVNNTFVNYQDRPIRHYNFGNPLGGTGAIEYALISHNSFINGMGFHGVLSLGTVGREIIITNNLFVDGFAAGEDSTDVTRTAEWANTGEQYANGNNRMAWIFGNPNDVTNWTVSNNFFAVTAAGQEFFDRFPEITVGEPLSIHIRERIGDAAANAFVKVDDPKLTNVPDLMLGLMDYYVTVAQKTKDTPNNVWDPQVHDMDRRPITYYNRDFDASYATTSDAYTGAKGGFPAGDLNWFPARKQDWITATSVDDADVMPTAYALEQNYPNPFNPTTTIRFQVAQTDFIEVAVYNLLGQRVAVLASGNHAPGSYTVNFDAGQLGSGIYLYTLETSMGTMSRRMTLIK
jgi:hypothetical protein